MALLLADENIPRSAITFLRSLGHEVKWVVEEGLQGTGDDALYEIAVAEQRILVSFDDYFAQRAYADKRRPAGVIVLKFKPRNTQEVVERLRSALADVGDLRGKLVIVQRTIVRVRPLL